MRGGALGLENGQELLLLGGRDAEAVRQTLDEQLIELTRDALALHDTVWRPVASAPPGRPGCWPRASLCRTSVTTPMAHNEE